METAKKSKKKAARSSADVVISAYRKTVLTEGKRPASVFKFCVDNNLTEDEFYQFFGSFEAVEKAIWTNYAVSTLERLRSDKNYAAFSIREKMLTFYFSVTEAFKHDRSFVLFQLKEWRTPGLPPSFIRGFKTQFDAWINQLLNEGKVNGEVARRPVLEKGYDGLFWVHFMFILQFWAKDDSANFEKTDEAIEKSVNLAFDVISKGILDNAIDFGKFLFQQSKN
jgi:Tetracyclin repressor-like, C-terminal domain